MPRKSKVWKKNMNSKILFAHNKTLVMKRTRKSLHFVDEEAKI